MRTSVQALLAVSSMTEGMLGLSMACLAVGLNAGCRTPVSDNGRQARPAIEYYRTMTQDDPGTEPARPSFGNRLPGRPAKGGYYEVLRGPDGKLSQIVVYGEFQGGNHPMGTWRYCYSGGRLEYLKFYSFALDPCPLKHVFHVQAYCVVDVIDGPLDSREYIAEIAVGDD